MAGPKAQAGTGARTETAAQPEPGPQTGSGRRPELDAIRTLVVVGLVFFHAALVFDERDDFYVKNSETTGVTMILAGFAVIWAMPLLFLTAGLGSWHSIRRRGTGGFVTERLLRLGVPLVFATLTIIPIPPWLRLRAADPAYTESYLEFLPRFFAVRLEPSDFPFILEGEHFETGHLWFVVLLLAFSLLLAPLVRLFPRDLGRRVRERAAGAVRRRGAVLLPAVPIALVSALLGLEEAFAGWHRWAYLLFFLCGFLLAADDRFRAAMRRDAVPAAVLGGALFLLGMPGFLLVGQAGGDPFTGLTPLAIGVRTLYGLAGWCWLVAILGLLDRPRPASPPPDQNSPADQRRPTGPDHTAGQDRPADQDRPTGRDRPDDQNRRTDRDGPADQDRPIGRGRLAGRRGASGGERSVSRSRRLYGYLAVGALPLYVLHQPIVVAVAYGVVGWDAPILVEYLVIVTVSFALLLAVYDLLVRRTPVTRFLFGMRRRAGRATR